MGNFLNKMRNGLARFMYGRNGCDQLHIAMLALYVALVLLQAVAAILFRSEGASALFSLLVMLLVFAMLFRMLSRNLDKRREENRKFLAWWMPQYRHFCAAQVRHRDKEHRYFRCRSCGVYCRVPRGKGRLEITCPRCHHTIHGKS